MKLRKHRVARDDLFLHAPLAGPRKSRRRRRRDTDWDRDNSVSVSASSSSVLLVQSLALRVNVSSVIYASVDGTRPKG